MQTPSPSKPIAIVGSGPAGLMAASVLSNTGLAVEVIEKRSSLGRKILIAGSSGLNISFDSNHEDFVKNYTGNASRWDQNLRKFSPQHWIQFIQKLGLETFLGTSGRYFVRGMKGATLLRAWTESLRAQNVVFRMQQECRDFEITPSSSVRLLIGNEWREYSAVLFALGGGSWEKTGKPTPWPEIFVSKKIEFTPFSSANCGYRVSWSEPFLKEAEGLPLKNITLTTSQGSKAGELVITRYGLEGTPVYTLGEKGPAWIDLKPSLTAEEILSKFNSVKENLSPIRRVKKTLKLSPAALALLYHLTPESTLNDPRALIQKIKKFPITLEAPQDLEEAISSKGGLHWDELDEKFMLKNHPGVFAAGEMLDWSAPTGGYLIQGCVSQGYAAAQGILSQMALLASGSR